MLDCDGLVCGCFCGAGWMDGVVGNGPEGRGDSFFSCLLMWCGVVWCGMGSSSLALIDSERSNISVYEYGGIWQMRSQRMNDIGFSVH